MINPFYLIVDDSKWLERLIPLGIKTVQLRIKNKSTAEIKQQIKAAKIICTQWQCTLIINDYWQEAIAQGCEYIHLGQEDLQQADIQTIRQNHLKLGISTHTPDELNYALSFQPDYIALGPIYPTTLKVMPYPPQGLENITLWKNKIGPIPLVAIGGITPERAPDIFKAGADSVCVLSDVLASHDPEKQVQKWLALCSSK